MPKFQIELDDSTFEALTALALEELRQVPQQAAWVLMQVLRGKAPAPQPSALPALFPLEAAHAVGALSKNPAS